MTRGCVEAGRSCCCHCSKTTNLRFDYIIPRSVVGPVAQRTSNVTKKKGAAEYARSGQLSPGMTNEKLLQAVDWIKKMMIAVATGGPRINEVQSEFAAKYDLVAEELAARGVPNTFPYRDLWQWYTRWSGGDMPSWQSRRNFVNALTDELVSNIKRAASGPVKVPAPEPTGWPRVDRTVTEVRKRLELASTEEQFQAIGLLCRETLISLAQAVFDPQRHPTVDGVRASDTDAKRMLEAYIAVEFRGSEHEYTRKHGRAACDLAVHLQHRRTASFRDAAACVEATTSMVNLIAIMAGLRDPEPF